MQTTLYMLTETSKFMMSFVIVTEQNNCIVVDGGRPEDIPLLKEYVGGRHISAWLLTHAHGDHITGIMSEMEKNGLADFDLEKLYYHFPDYDEWMKHVDEAPNPTYMRNELNEQIPRFNRLVPCLGDRVHIAQQGETIQVDEVKIDILYTTHDGLYANPMNDSSMVFKVTTPRKTMLFLGDLGPEGGDILFDESRHLLKSDIVQMAHHGHECVQMHVYAEIMPEACMWCAAQWLYDEPELPGWLQDREKLRKRGRIRMYGVALTRKWMDILGVKTHYVTANGTQTVLL